MREGENECGVCGLSNIHEWICAASLCGTYRGLTSYANNEVYRNLQGQNRMIGQREYVHELFIRLTLLDNLP